MSRPKQPVDEPEVGVEHVPPDQQHRERRHRVRQDEQRAVEALAAQPLGVQHDRDQQAEREGQPDDGDREGEVPDQDPKNDAGDDRVGQHVGEVAEADVDLPALGEVARRLRRRRSRWRRPRSRSAPVSASLMQSQLSSYACAALPSNAPDRPWLRMAPFSVGTLKAEMSSLRAPAWAMVEDGVAVRGGDLAGRRPGRRRPASSGSSRRRCRRTRCLVFGSVSRKTMSPGGRIPVGGDA